MAKKKAVKKSVVRSTPKRDSEHNVMKIVLTTIVVWGVVLLAIVYMLQSVHDHMYMISH